MKVRQAENNAAQTILTCETLLTQEESNNTELAALKASVKTQVGNDNFPIDQITSLANNLNMVQPIIEKKAAYKNSLKVLKTTVIDADYKTDITAMINKL